jgi:hypothetical protein
VAYIESRLRPFMSRRNSSLTSAHADGSRVVASAEMLTWRCAAFAARARWAVSYDPSMSIMIDVRFQDVAATQAELDLTEAWSGNIIDQIFPRRRCASGWMRAAAIRLASPDYLANGTGNPLA